MRTYTISIDHRDKPVAIIEVARVDLEAGLDTTQLDALDGREPEPPVPTEDQLRAAFMAGVAAGDTEGVCTDHYLEEAFAEWHAETH